MSMEISIFAENKQIMGTSKDKTTAKDNATEGAAKKTSATPEKKFKLHRMTKKELLECRIPVYDYLIP